MRIVLDRQRLLGFENSRSELEVPTFGAKVGSKTDTISVRTACHGDLLKGDPVDAALTFPA